MEFFGISGVEALVIVVVGLLVMGPTGMARAVRTWMDLRAKLVEARAFVSRETAVLVAEGGIDSSGRSAPSQPAPKSVEN